MAEERYVTMAEAARFVGVSRYRIGLVVKRAGVQLFRSHIDRRKKFMREGDLWLLTAPRQSGQPKQA